MIFYIGTSPNDAYMLPSHANMMLNASQFYVGGWDVWEVSRPRNAGKVFLDSGGYVFFNRLGEYPFTIGNYINLVAKLRPHYYASMDYPCEDSISSTLGNLSNEERIQKTVQNAVELARFEHWNKAQLVPVIQGYTVEEYKHCIDLYAAAGLIREYMAVGSMCTRSNDVEIVTVWREVHAYATAAGVKRLHAFGLKRSPHLEEIDHLIYSRDSAAVYYAQSMETRKRWRKMRGGNPAKFAPSRKEKRVAVREFTQSLEERGFKWCEVR